MTFLAPWALWLAGLAPVIVLLYLLKLRRRPVAVSTLMFWQRVLQESRRRALFQRLRQLISLLLHLLIFALILLALAKPTFDRAIRAGSSTVLILDARARMQALEPDGASRFEKALQLAAQTTRQAGEMRQVAILTAAAGVHVAAPFTGDEKRLRETLDRLSPTDAGDDLAPAVRLAEELLASRTGEKRIVLLSAPGASDPPLSSSIPLVRPPFGSSLPNTAITRFASRPLPASPETSEILLELRNFSRAPATGNVELALDGRLLDVHPYTLAPGEQKLEVFPAVPRATTSARGWLTARLDTPDALAADNTAHALLPTQPPRRVLLITPGNWFLEKLLEADTRLRFELLTPDAFRLDMASQFDAVLLDGHLPPGFDLATTPGQFLFIKSTPFATSAPSLEQPLVTDADSQHPTLRLVQLQHATFARAAALQLPAPRDGWTFEAPLRSGEHPLFIIGSRRGKAEPQRLAALAFDIADSDLPLRVAFPLFMANTIHWLAGTAPPEPRTARTGEIHPLAPGAVLAPSPEPASPAQPPAATVRDSFQPLHSGLYRIEQPGVPPEWLAVNAFDARESDLQQATSDAPAAEGSDASPFAFRPSAFLAWPLWHHLALAAALLLTGEWWLFHRRRTE